MIVLIHGVNGSKSEVEVTPETTFLELLGLVNHNLGLRLKSEDLDRLSLLTGFPPKALSLNMDQPISGFVGHKDSLKAVVRHEDIDCLKAAAPVTVPKDKKATVKKQAHSRSSSSSIPPSRTGGNIFTLGCTTTASPKKRRRNVMGSSEDDISATLIAAQQGNGENHGRFWRRVMSNAVKNQYETSKAIDRVSASRNGIFRFEDDPAGGRRADGSAAAIMVTFPKAGGRSEHTDEGLETIDAEALKHVIEDILGDPSHREMLKPENMSLCSPRVFWALVKFSGGLDIPKSLELLLPSVDWAFLTIRMRKLSEKALANAAQAADDAEETIEHVEEDVEEEEESEKDTDQVFAKEEASAPQPPQPPQLSARERAAMAAESRLRAQSAPQPVVGNSDNGTTPTSLLNRLDEICGAPWAQVLRTYTTGTNPLFAVSCHDEAIIASLADAGSADLAARLTEAHAGAGLLSGHASSNSFSDDVDEWVLAARDAECVRIFHQIVGNSDLVRSLETIRITTPRDLVLWTKRPSMLRSMLAKRARQGADSSAADAVLSRFSDEVQAEWLRASAEAINSHPWLDGWITGRADEARR